MKTVIGFFYYHIFLLLKNFGVKDSDHSAKLYISAILSFPFIPIIALFLYLVTTYTSKIVMYAIYPIILILVTVSYRYVKSVINKKGIKEIIFNKYAGNKQVSRILGMLVSFVAILLAPTLSIIMLLNLSKVLELFKIGR